MNFVPNLSFAYPRLLRVANIFLLLSVIASCASQKAAGPLKPSLKKGDYRQGFDYLRTYIHHQRNANDVAGISVAVVVKDQGGWLRWAEGFGVKNIQPHEDVTIQTRFRAGSLIKVLNAVAILQLADQGLVDLDEDIRTYLPQFTVRSRFAKTKITLRQLLTHQSGLPSDWIFGMWRASPGDFHDVLGYLDSVYVSQPPNTVYQYSNIGHNVIALIIEAVTGQAYSDYIHSQLMQPLDMQHSRIAASPEQPPTAQSIKHGKKITEFATRETPAAGLTSTARDYAQLVTKLLQTDTSDVKARKSPHIQARVTGTNRWLSDTALATLFRDHTSQHPLNFSKRSGLGLYRYDDVFSKNYPVFGHDGATPGQRALVKFSPKLDMGVVVMANSPYAAATLHRIANHSLQLLYELKFGRRPPYPYYAPPQKSTNDIVEAQSLQGYYASALGLAQISMKKNKPVVKALGKTFQLQQHDDSSLYFLNYRLLGLWNIDLGYYGRVGLSVRKVDGKKYLIGTNHRQHKQLLGQAIEPVQIPNAWKQRVGRYEVETPLEAMELPSGGIKIQDGFLVAYAKTAEGQKLEYVLQPVSDDEAIVAGVGRGLGETVFGFLEKGQKFVKFADIRFKKID